MFFLFLFLVIGNTISYFSPHRVLIRGKGSALKRFVLKAPQFGGLISSYESHENVSDFRARFYTENLNFSICREHYSADSTMWNSFLEDVRPDEDAESLLGNISIEAQQFVNSNEVYDRNEIINSLKLINKGDMIILTGGPSTGKSLLLRTLFGSHPQYLFLNGRKSGSNLINAVIESIKINNRLKDVKMNAWSAIAPTVIKSISELLLLNTIPVPSLLNDKLPDVLVKIYEAASKNPDSGSKSLTIIFQLISSIDPPIEGIIFDEANVYFTKDSLPFLNCLTAFTKEDRKLSVIMATSDYGFPFTLSNIGYNRNHVKQSLVLSDVSPRDTLALLTRWGVRPKLAYLLVDMYGGHILQISRALNDLCNEQENANIYSSFINGLDDQLVTCIAESKKMNIENDVKLALEALMRTGFYPCEFNNPAADLITKCNVGGFIGRNAKIPGLSRKLQCGRSGVVPSTQMIRIVFALCYNEFFSDRGDGLL
eukprot:gene6413-8829_t